MQLCFFSLDGLQAPKDRRSQHKKGIFNKCGFSGNWQWHFSFFIVITTIMVCTIRIGAMMVVITIRNISSLETPSHSKLSFHLFDFTFGQKSSTALETQLADSLAVVAEEQHRDREVLRFSSLTEICRSRCGRPRARSRCPATQRRWGGEGGIWDGLGFSLD